MPDLAATFAVLKPDQSVTLVDVSPTIYQVTRLNAPGSYVIVPRMQNKPV